MVTMMTEAFEIFWATIGPALLGLIGSLVSMALYRAQQALAATRDSQAAKYAEGVLRRLDEAVRVAVSDAALEQELSRRLSDGRLTADETRELVVIARERAVEYLGPKGARELARVVDPDALQALILGRVRASIERRLGDASWVLSAVSDYRSDEPS